MPVCSCDCHERARQASIKRKEAQKAGTFYYYHEDCYCCVEAYMPSFGDLNALHDRRKTGLQEGVGVGE